MLEQLMIFINTKLVSRKLTDEDRIFYEQIGEKILIRWLGEG